MVEYTFDTSFIVKGLIYPRRKKQDSILKNQEKIHTLAKQYLTHVSNQKAVMYIPSLALIETATVIMRLTNSKEDANNAVQYLKENASEIFYDADILDEAINMGIKTKGRSFDLIFMTVAKSTGSILLTDDNQMYNLSKETGIKSFLLRNLL